MTDVNPFDAVVGGQQPSDNPFDAVVGGQPQSTPAPAPAANPFEDAVLQGEERRKRQQFLETLKNSKDVVPERQARAIEVAKLRGVPVGVAYQYLDELEPKAGPDYDDLAKRAPETARLLSDPIKGPVTFTDYEPLSAMEQAMRDLGTPKGYDAEEFRKNAGEAALQQFTTRLQSIGTKTPEESVVATEQNVKERAAEIDEVAERKRQADLVAAQRQAEREQDPNFAFGGENYNPESDLTRFTARQEAEAKGKAAREDLELALKNPVTQDAWRNLFDRAIVGALGMATSAANRIGAQGDISTALLPDDFKAYAEYTRFLPAPFNLLFTPPSAMDEKGQGPITRGAAAADDLLSRAFPGDPSRQEDFSSKVASGAGSIAGFAAFGTLARALGFSASTAAGILGALSQGGANARDAQNAGAAPWEQALSTLAGDLSGATEALVPWDDMLSGFPGSSTWLQTIIDWGLTATKEGGQEFSQQLIADSVPALTYDKGRDVWGNAFEAALIGAITGGGLAAVMTAVSSGAESRYDKILALGDAASKTKLADIAPKILDEHIDRLKKAGAAPEQVTAAIEAVETLFQELTAEMAQQFPQTAKSLEEARRLKEGDPEASTVEVTIPTEELVRLGKLNGYKTFAADVRIGDEMTLNEVSKLRTDLEKQLVETDTAAGTPSQDDSPVFKDMRAQLIKAGNSPDVATAQARLMDAFFTTQSERTGVPAMDLARRYGLEVSNSALDPKQGDTVLQQDTSTPEFRNWFGDSKVVDESGAPLVVYHGTASDFSAFDPDKAGASIDSGFLGKGSYFSSHPSTAGYYADVADRGRGGQNVMPTYVSLKNPFMWGPKNQGVRALVMRGEPLPAAIHDKVIARTGFEFDPAREYDPMDERMLSEAVTEVLKGMGHDGVIASVDGDPTAEIVAFDPTQIKSATGNRGTFDPNNPNILFQTEAPTVDGQSQQPGNKHGLAPHLRVETGAAIPAKKKPLFAQTTMNSTAPRQIAAIDEVLARHPNATASVENWNAMMSDALASNDVPLPPYNFIKNLNGDGSRELLAKLSPGQIADADHGFANAARFRQGYIDGQIKITDTGRLFLWSFLSRGVSPYTQESLFIDSFNGIDQWIEAAANGTLKDRLGEYEAWAKSAAPQGSGQPGAGATHNLNAFGKLFLLKMSEDAGDGSGRSRLQVLHDMMADPNATGREVRRKFLEMGEGVGIDNKVVSFTLLVAGFTDVMVLDRVQIRELWNDGRFDGINLYDGYKVDGKPVAGSALSNLTYGARGLLIYEAIEQGLKAKVGELYAQLGRPEAASPGRYHWETWVASSNQEASHATIDAILAHARGANAPLDGVTAKEGEYGAYAYGARYGRDAEGTPYFLYSVPGTGDFKFTVASFREFLGEIQVRANGIIPAKFKVTESGNGPWYTRPEVSLPKLGELAGRIGARYEADTLSAADARHGIDPPISNRLAADQPGTPPAGAETRVTEGPSPGPSSSQTTLNQGGPEARGYIQFGPLRDKFRITLTEKANLSTFIHEGGHFFLEVLQDLVARGEASAQQVADLKTLKRWMAIEDAKQIDRNGHEKFARTWEQFLMEGKAPSLALHGIFQKFKAWMIFVYKRLANVRGDLNDEIRQVMDRLVASDAAIAEARALVGWRGQPMSQEETGLTDAEYKAYVGEWTKANDAQSQDADARIMLEAARSMKQAWTDEKNKITLELEKELSETRGWKTWKLLANGEGLDQVRPGWSDMKIDPESIPREWRRDAAGMTAAPHEGGLPLDMVAESLGFTSGEQMFSVIAGAKLTQRAIPARVRQIMAERHGEMNVASLAQEAMKAVHNTPTMDVLLTEFRALAAKANLKVGKDTKRMVRAAAEERVAQLTQRQLDPGKWRRAEVKAAEETGKLAAKGRDMEAALAKRRQLMAAAMAKASLEAQDRIAVIKDYLATFTTNRRRAALGKAGDTYLDAVDQILEGVQLKEVSLKAIAARKSLADFVKEQEAAGEPVFISDATRDLLGRKNYSELTLEELEGIHDAVKNLWTVARDVTQVRKGQEKMALEQAIADITAEADATLPEKKQRDHLNPTRIDKMMRGFSRYHAGNLKIEFILDWLGKTAGDLIYKPISDAAYKSWTTHRDLSAPFLDKLRDMPSEQKRRWATKRKFMDLPMEVTGANIWMAALNLGNEGNKAKLLAGYGWSEAQLRAELNQFMTKADWDLVQETLDTIEKLWPQLEAVVKKATGLPPPKVEATPIDTPFGTYRGGYFPVVYDTVLDERMSEKLDNSITPEEMFAKRFTAFVINNGFTKGRTANTGKLLLSPSVIADHLSEVIHYVTHYDAVRQADKVMRSPAFKRLVKTRLSDSVYAEMKQWLVDVATNTTATDRKAGEGDRTLRWVRQSAQLTFLGLNVLSALKQPLGVVNALDAIGPVHWAHGVQKAWLSPSVVKNWRFALDHSKELRPMLQNYDRDAAQIAREFEKNIGSRVKERAYLLAFAPINVMQATANVATWHGAYLQATKQGMSEDDAYAFADKTVRMTQGAGGLKDLAGIQRGGEASKLFTMFYSYFSVVYNRMADIQTREKGAKNLHRKAMRYTILLLLPSLLNMYADDAWNEMFHEDRAEKDAEKPFLARLALETSGAAAAAFPIYREGYSVLEAVALGNRPRSVAAISVLDTLFRAGTAVKGIAVDDDELTRSKARAIVAATGMVTGTPVYGIYRLIDDVFGQKMFDE